MTHVTDKLQAFIDDELTPAQMAAVREHCAGCSACERALSELRRVWLLVDAGRAPALCHTQWPDVQERIAARPTPGSRWARTLAASAAVAAGLVLGIWVGGQDGLSGSSLADTQLTVGTTLIEDGAYYVESAMPTLDELWLAVADQEGEPGS